MSFASIQAFRDYFRLNDELHLQPNQRLEIQDISSLTEQVFLGEKELFPNDISQLANYVLQKMVLPLAKSIEIQYGAQEGLSCHLDDHFSLSHQNGIQLRAQRGPIYARLTDLFKTMITSSIPTVEFVPGQQLVLGLTEAEQDLEATVANIPNIIDSKTPEGFKVSIEVEGQDSEWQVSSRVGEYAGSVQARVFTIQSSHAWRLTLSEPPNFLFSVERFFSRMQLKDELTVPPNQILRIQGEFFSRLEEEYDEAPFTAPTIGYFALNQTLLPLGRTVQIIEHGAHGVRGEWGGDFLELSSESGFTLKAGFGDLFAKLTHLGQSLISNRISSLRLHPGQQLFIYGLNDTQKEQLSTWVTSTDWETIKMGLRGFFMPYNPVGFVWELKHGIELYKGLAVWDYPNATAFMVRSSQGLDLALERAPGGWLVLNLINNSSPELLQGILETDPKALLFILFKAIWYYCSDGFSTKEPPNFFKENTQQNLTALLEGNREFAHALLLVRENQEMRDQLSKILSYSPNEFSQLNFKALPDHLGSILTPIIGLVYQELPGSPFIAQCVKTVHDGLVKGDLQNLLKNPLLKS